MWPERRKRQHRRQRHLEIVAGTDRLLARSDSSWRNLAPAPWTIRRSLDDVKSQPSSGPRGDDHSFKILYTCPDFLLKCHV